LLIIDKELSQVYIRKQLHLVKEQHMKMNVLINNRTNNLTPAANNYVADFVLFDEYKYKCKF